MVFVKLLEECWSLCEGKAAWHTMARETADLGLHPGWEWPHRGRSSRGSQLGAMRFSLPPSFPAAAAVDLPWRSCWCSVTGLQKRACPGLVLLTLLRICVLSEDVAS